MKKCGDATDVLDKANEKEKKKRGAETMRTKKDNELKTKKEILAPEPRKEAAATPRRQKWSASSLVRPGRGDLRAARKETKKVETFSFAVVNIFFYREAKILKKRAQRAKKHGNKQTKKIISSAVTTATTQQQPSSAGT